MFKILSITLKRILIRTNMCKYCNLDKNGITEPLVSGLGVCCELVIENNNYYLVIYGDSAEYSEPMRYCPFCGRELKVEENKKEV